MADTPHTEPVATYRMQLRNGFDFAQAADIAPYLTALGVSHCYLSPFLAAAEASTHGYDIVDPTRVDGALGGATGYSHLCQALQAEGLRQMIDLVPNHMAIGAPDNRWWWDVLTHGRQSRYAGWFDVTWPTEGPFAGKVLLPVLGDHYGRVLENGELRLCRNRGGFSLTYHDQRFPVNLTGLGDLLRRAAAAADSTMLAFLADCCAGSHQSWDANGGSSDSRRGTYDGVIQQLLERLCLQNAAVAGAIDREVAHLNTHPDALDALIGRQHYRPAFWRCSGDQLNHRRFFDIDSLIGVRVELSEVFNATHQFPLHWVREGHVHGLRIDHPDGLWDPTGYFQRLRAACPDTWILAEKILEPGEPLPAQWPIDGTTGYDFLNQVGGLFVDGDGLMALGAVCADFTGESLRYADLVAQCKALVLDQLFGSEMGQLTDLLVAVCQKQRRHRDYTRRELTAALARVAVRFPVYRSYGRVFTAAGRVTVSEEDAARIRQAVDGARADCPELDPSLFAFLASLLLLEINDPAAIRLALRFQQFTGPLMAKGVEDTAFYRFHRLVACNEVGADPDRYAVTPQAFHRFCADTLAHYPRTLLTTSTHDTKRSEDVRARLALLSEIPRQWADAVGRWADHNQNHRSAAGPDKAAEYLFYQTLVGAWPIEADRLTAFMTKAVREAKLYTSWTQPAEDYEAAVDQFVKAAMADAGFTDDVAAFVAPLVRPGRINSLAQTLIKLTAPGVPDIYQGTELWDLSLVDPDNRRPVDYQLRQRLLQELDGCAVETIMERMDEGLPKLWLIRQALHLRRRRPVPFGSQGDYRPLTAEGSKADHVLAFARGDQVVTIVPRRIMGLANDWSDTRIQLPPGRWHNRLGDDMILEAASIRLADLLERFPVALLVKEE
ncbi:malto-oligosyltrehalose synthase [Desulfatitalea alkaliphila]|uniref:Malto-oligosyltrehalose synthase n=1 Tax=Desulfatitalea alkaliphila TaxID=2929485 RepID=A0AA41UIA3_9BACT|nr:malto-oligosyltrehalose synthase [Desulfatitalea alkaliphila]MCJ8500550.1 malto-oligosyltrehalose synthase [Desulfatitalea alkaliphila]